MFLPHLEEDFLLMVSFTASDGVHHDPVSLKQWSMPLEQFYFESV